jgi:hypothetical protein
VGVVEDIGVSFIRVAVPSQDGEKGGGNYVFLPRTKWQVEDTAGVFHEYLQYPIQAAYARTTAIIQGATVRSLFWDVTGARVETTNHGNTYVVVGRVEAAHQICFVGKERRRSSVPNVTDSNYLRGTGRASSET